MKLIFLDRKTLAYKDNAYVGNQYEIVLDSVLIQRSTFSVNKTSINTVNGDILILKEASITYIGIVESIEEKDIYTDVKSVDFREMFDVQIPVYSFSGDLVDYLYTLIEDNYINSSDSNQNLSYLYIVKESYIQGDMYYESDKIEKISTVTELLSKAYGIGYRFEVEYLRGRITGIKLRIVDVSLGIKIRSDLKAISNLTTNDSSSQLTNKVTYYPKTDNEVCKSIENFYLQTNGEITQAENSYLRYSTVMSKSYFYTDNDYDSLVIKARSEMVSSKLDHNITFTIDINNKIFRLFDNVNLGDYISFIHNGREYDTIISGIKFKNCLNYAQITLGEYRVKLTEKIQLLSKSTKQSNTSVTITNNNLDGGEF
ncbi:MAG: hypothetical protein WC154_00280 [Candidatus Izemoplasmatales bacterium]